MEMVYEMVNSQSGYNHSHIQQARMELGILLSNFTDLSYFNLKSFTYNLRQVAICISKVLKKYNYFS